jgi:hypothetical protein
VALEQQSSQHASARIGAVDARADDAVAADRSRAEDVHADIHALAVGGRRSVREDDVGAGPAGDVRRRFGEAGAGGVPRASRDPVIAVPAVEPRAGALEVVADEGVVPAEAADRPGPDQDVGPSFPTRTASLGGVVGPIPAFSMSEPTSASCPSGSC